MISSVSKQINLTIKTIIYSLLGILFLSFFLIQNNFELLGAFAGKFSIYTLWIIAIPGILKRFKVKGKLKNIQLVLMLNRRLLGILMFVLVVVHFLWSRGFGYILKGPPTSIPTFQIFGTLAFLLCIPLALTSNNFAQKKMKKWWQRLHYLTYVVMLLAVFHTAMQGVDAQIFGLKISLEYTLSYALPTVLIMIAQMVSWIWYFRDKKLTA